MKNIEIKTLNQLNYELAQALRNFIVLNQHVDTGDMYRSVKFNCVDPKGDGTSLKVKFSSKFYIRYLQHGDFIKRFFKIPEFKSLVNNYVKNKAIDNVKSSINIREIMNKRS